VPMQSGQPSVIGHRVTLALPRAAEHVRLLLDDGSGCRQSVRTTLPVLCQVST
jgi:hypothetical protein